MKDTDFIYASAYTRTLENKMLGRADYEALLNVPSCEYALRYLSDKGYRGGKEELAYAWNEVKDACPKGAPLHVLLYQNDFHNLKTILKTVFSGDSAAYTPLMLEPYTISPEEIYRAVTEGKLEGLPAPFQEPALEAYQILARDNDGQAAEIVLDKALFSAMGEAALQSENDFLIGWVDLNIMLINTKTALRGGAQSAMLGDGKIAPGAPKASITALELWCDNQLISYLRQARCITFGFAPVFGFLVGKQFEAQAVRMILSGLRHGVPAEALRERMRDLYV